MRKGDSQPQFDALTVFKHASKLAKGEHTQPVSGLGIMAKVVVVELAITKKLGTQLLHGLEV